MEKDEEGISLGLICGTIKDFTGGTDVNYDKESRAPSRELRLSRTRSRGQCWARQGYQGEVSALISNCNVHSSGQGNMR